MQFGKPADQRQSQARAARSLCAPELRERLEQQVELRRFDPDTCVYDREHDAFVDTLGQVAVGAGRKIRLEACRAGLAPAVLQW